MNTQTKQVSYARRAAIGSLLILPPLLFVTAAVLKYGLGIGIIFNPLENFLTDPQRLSVFNIISPILFLDGLVLAATLNILPSLRFTWHREDAILVTTLTLQARTGNILVVVTSAILFTVLLGYAFLENFTLR